MGKATAETYDPSKPLDNDKHEAFCLEYLKDFNATQAYIRAGYSADTANKSGPRLLVNVGVQARLAYLREQVNKGRIMEAQEIRERLTDIGRAKITDIIHFNESGATFLKDSKDIDPKHAAAIESISFIENSQGVNFKVKMRDPIKAIVPLGKDQGMFTDKIEHSLDKDLENRLTDALRHAQNGKDANSNQDKP
jgi:phage terminase small subunit